MDRRTYLAALAGTAALAGCSGVPGSDADATPPAGDGHDVETVTDGLDHPWGIAAHPDGDRLFVTERDAGELAVVGRRDGTVRRVEGTPSVFADGQGGMLDVALHPGFPATRWVYLTYSAANDAGESATHLGRGRLEDGAFSTFEVLWVAEPFVDSGGHFGSRAAFGPEGRLYVTAGDRQFKDFGPDHVAQDTSNELGAVLRLEADGSVPADNPFVGDAGVRDAIYSYGHRNPQGLAVHPETGSLWASEHGERDGDELNVIEAGNNYGWPVASEACNYGTDDPVGDSHADRADVTAPVHHWPCGSGGFPPGGMAFYDGAADDWRGDLFVADLAGQYLGRFAVEGRDVEEVGALLAGRDWRIRDAEAADDHLYVAIDDADAPVVRIDPA